MTILQRRGFNSSVAEALAEEIGESGVRIGAAPLAEFDKWLFEEQANVRGVFCRCARKWSVNVTALSGSWLHTVSDEFRKCLLDFNLCSFDPNQGTVTFQSKFVAKNIPVKCPSFQ